MYTIRPEIIRVISKLNHRVAKVAKFATQRPSLPFTFLQFRIIGYFKQTLKPNWLFCFSVPVSLEGEKVQIKAENSAIRE